MGAVTATATRCTLSVSVQYRHEAEALLRLSRETDDAVEHARHVLAAQFWLNRAVAAEERSFARLDEPVAVAMYLVNN